MNDQWLGFGMGVVVGVLIGVLIDDLFESVRNRRRRNIPMTAKPATVTTKDKHREQFKGAMVWLLGISVAANVGIGALMIYTRIQQTSFTECVVDYNQQFSSAYKARLASSGQASDALDRVMIAVAGQDRAEFKAALASYVELREAVKAQQRAHPYPALPDVFCGDVGK